MRKTAIWCIPCAFFVVACILNLIGSIQGSALANTVKPAIMPLLAVTTLACLLGHDFTDYRPVGLLVAAQLYGAVGDVLLIPNEFNFFVGGMVAFLIGHICYMGLFGGQSWKGLTAWQWAISLVILAAAVFGLVKVIGVHGELFWPIIIYAFGLMMLIFSALAGVLRMPHGQRATWWILLLGTILFAFSDACIAMDIFGVMSFPLHLFLIMITYFAAQSLLAIGGVRLIQGR